MFRTLTYLAALLVFTIYYGGGVIIANLLKVPNRPGGIYDQAARRWSRWLLRAAGIRVRIVGVERLSPDRPVVYVSNHQSWFDILALAANLPGTVRFVSKKELEKIPILGRAMRRAGHIFLDRHNRQKAFSAYEEVSEVIAAGLSAVVFAEGTRSRTGDLQHFKKGPFVLAIAAQVPVVPVYCAGTFTILPKGSIRVRPHDVTLYVGDAIPTKGLDYEDRERLLQDARHVIREFRRIAGEARASDAN